MVERITCSAYGRPSFTDANGRTRSGPTFGPTDAYGQLVTPHTLAVAWQGRAYDLETGHSYNRARTLSHRLGRFLQRDPLGYVDGMSLYEYVGGDPAGSLDPLGLEDEDGFPSDKDLDKAAGWREPGKPGEAGKDVGKGPATPPAKDASGVITQDDAKKGAQQTEKDAQVAKEFVKGMGKGGWVWSRV